MHERLKFRRWIVQLDLPLDPDNEVDLGLTLNVEVSVFPGLTLETDLLLLLGVVLLDVGLGTLEDDFAGSLRLLLVVIVALLQRN